MKNAKKITGLILLGLIVVASTLVFITRGTEAFNYGTQNYGECLYGGEIGNTALTFTVNTTLVALGTLSVSSTNTGTATFNVTQRCSNSGYIVTVSGATPTNGTHNIINMPATTISSIGTEQFGMNLVANTVPSVGAAASGGSGLASSGYATVNQFKYVSGDQIASAAQNSTDTTYTVSFIANSSSVTPAGSYNGVLTLICTATF